MFAVFVATGVVAAVAFGPARPEGATIIRGTAIVDVEHGVLVRGKDIIVRGGVIEGVEPAGVVKAGEGDAEIAVAGLFALPGLFDAHVHLTASPETYPKLLVAHGVTAARDMGGPTELVLGLQESFAKAEQVGPDLFVTGAIIDGDPPVWPFSEPVDTPEEGRAAVRKLKEAGVDMIKVYSRLNKDVYEAVVDEAHKVGLKATGHIPESVTLAEAIAAGQDCNEHLMRVDVAIAALAGHQEERDRPLTRLMSGWAHFDEVPAEKLEGVARSIGAAGMVQCPTLIVTAGIGRADQDETLKDPQMAYVPSHMSAFWTGPGYRNGITTGPGSMACLRRFASWSRLRAPTPAKSRTPRKSSRFRARRWPAGSSRSNSASFQRARRSTSSRSRPRGSICTATIGRRVAAPFRSRSRPMPTRPGASGRRCGSAAAAGPSKRRTRWLGMS
jgi:hypothetical protein